MIKYITGKDLGCKKMFYILENHESLDLIGFGFSDDTLQFTSARHVSGWLDKTDDSRLFIATATVSIDDTAVVTAYITEYGTRAYYTRADHVLLGEFMDLREVSTWEYLLQAGADICTNNNAALVWAASTGNCNLVEFLLQNGANVHVCGDEPLMKASANGYYDVVNLLCKSATANAKGMALIRAAENGHYDVAKLLISFANLNDHINDAIDVAIENNHKEIARMLVLYGAEISAVLESAKMNPDCLREMILD